MKRPYTLRRRAEQQAETRRRIVEAAVDLHSTVGPARTTVSMIAERAGVQRHTLYAHFPTEWDIRLACSGHVYAQDPLPDADAWRGIGDQRERLRTGLTAIYGWYERHASLMACVSRDSEIDELTQKIGAMRVAPVTTAWRDVLGANLNAKQHAMLQLALSFYTWRTLVRDAGLPTGAARDAMVEAILGAT